MELSIKEKENSKESKLCKKVRNLKSIHLSTIEESKNFGYCTVRVSLKCQE